MQMPHRRLRAQEEGDPKGDQRKERKAKPSTDQTPPTGPLTFTNPKDIQTPTNQGNLKGPKEKLRKDAGVVDLACMKISTKEGSRRPPPGQSKRNTSGPPRPRPRQRTTPGPRRGHRPESKPRSRSAPHPNAARAPNPTQQDGALQAHQAPHRPRGGGGGRTGEGEGTGEGDDRKGRRQQQGRRERGRGGGRATREKGQGGGGRAGRGEEGEEARGRKGEGRGNHGAPRRPTGPDPRRRTQSDGPRRGGAAPDTRESPATQHPPRDPGNDQDAAATQQPTEGQTRPRPARGDSSTCRVSPLACSESEY
ncbi:uncharacterized protein LOC144034170 [Vanacampus margaritifer]